MGKVVRNKWDGKVEEERWAGFSNLVTKKDTAISSKVLFPQLGILERKKIPTTIYLVISGLKQRHLGSKIIRKKL